MAQRNSKRRSFKKEKKEFDEEVISIDRVTRVVKGGRRLRFRATVVIGDRKGRVGIGVGKSNEVTGAIAKAITKAKKSLVTIPLINGTIPHEIKHKFKAAKIMLMPAAPGTGIIAGGSVRKVVSLVGIKNIMGKSLGSNNKLNTTRAAFEALKLLKENPYIKPNDSEVKGVKAESKNVVKENNADNKGKKKAVKEEKAPKHAEQSKAVVTEKEAQKKKEASANTDVKKNNILNA